MNTFDDFKKEMHERARKYAATMEEEHGSVNIEGSSGSAGSLLIASVIVAPVKAKYLKEKFSYVYDTEKKRFIKATVTARKITPHKRQPKNPVTLDNYEFYSTTPGLVGIHKKPDPVFVNVGCTHVSSGMIFRGQQFTDEQYKRMKELQKDGVSFEEAAKQAKAA